MNTKLSQKTRFLQVLTYTYRVNIRTTIIAALTFLWLFCSTVHGQQPTPSPSSKDDPKDRITVLKLNLPHLKEELAEAEVEPRSKQFRINLRFLRAKYSRPTLAAENVTGQQYLWDYFSEAIVLIQFFEFPAGYFSSRSLEGRKVEVSKLLDSTLEKAAVKKISEKDVKIGSEPGKEVEASMQGYPIKVRTFAHGDVWYVLMIRPKTDEARPLIQKLFDSFEFARDPK